MHSTIQKIKTKVAETALAFISHNAPEALHGGYDRRRVGRRWSYEGAACTMVCKALPACPPPCPPPCPDICPTPVCIPCEMTRPSPSPYPEPISPCPCAEPSLPPTPMPPPPTPLLPPLNLQPQYPSMPNLIPPEPAPLSALNVTVKTERTERSERIIEKSSITSTSTEKSSYYWQNAYSNFSADYSKKCLICREVTLEPVESLCCHKFYCCSRCAPTIKVCEICKSTQFRYNALPPQPRPRCPYCPYECRTRADLVAHINTCEHVTMKCPFESCSQTFKRNDYYKHISERHLDMRNARDMPEPNRRFDVPDIRHDGLSNRLDLPERRFDAPERYPYLNIDRNNVPDRYPDMGGMRDMPEPHRRYDVPDIRLETQSSRLDLPERRFDVPERYPNLNVDRNIRMGENNYKKETFEERVTERVTEKVTRTEREEVFNTSGNRAQVGSNGKHYCGRTLESKCLCCNGVCGPTNGCNCVYCMELDIEIRKLPRGTLINREGIPSTRSIHTGLFFCEQSMGDAGQCRPYRGMNCFSCQMLDRMASSGGPYATLI